MWSGVTPLSEFEVRLADALTFPTHLGHTISMRMSAGERLWSPTVLQSLASTPISDLYCATRMNDDDRGRVPLLGMQARL